MVNQADLDALRVEEVDLSQGDLILEADDGESLEILARGVSGGADDDLIEEAVDEETMLAYPATDGEADLFPQEAVYQVQTDVHGKLRTMGLTAPTLKVPEGDTYQLISEAGNGTATVLYTEGGPNFAQGTTPGGPDTKNRTFISSAEEAVEVEAGATTTAPVETSQNPGVLRDFPYEEAVPSRREYDLQALAITVDTAGSGANISLDGFKLQSEERDFIARESDFIDTAIAPYPDPDLTALPLTFPDEPTFEPGDELDIILEVSNSGTATETAVVDVSTVFYRRGVGV